MLDDLDARIVRALDADPTLSTLALARELAVARNTVQARLKRLEAEVLGPVSRRLQPEALGYTLVAFMSLLIAQSSGDRAVAGLRAIPEVVEVHAITGDADLLVKVVARSTADLRRVTAAVVALDGINRSNTWVSLAEEVPTRLAPLLETPLITAS